MEIIETVTEETAVKVQVIPEKGQLQGEIIDTSILVEAFDNKKTTAKWIEENLLFDIRDEMTRETVAKSVLDIYKQLLDDPTILQIKHHVATGETQIVHFDEELSYESVKYENILPDVQHIIDNKKRLADQKHNGAHEFSEFGTENYECNIVNRHDAIVFFGYHESEYTVFENIFKQPVFFTHSLEGVVSSLSTKLDKSNILVVKNTLEFVEGACSLVEEYADNIKCVICDTVTTVDMRHHTSKLLGLCRVKGVLICRSLFINNCYNFGVDVIRDLGNTRKNVGYIDMGDEMLTRDCCYLVRLDSRMAQLKDFIEILNKRNTVHFILINHTMNVKYYLNLENYKFFPEFQTKQINQLFNLIYGGIVNTPIACYTEFPGIANALFSCGVYCACDRDIIFTYMNNVFRVLYSWDSDRKRKVLTQLEQVCESKIEKITKQLEKSLQLNNN